MWKTSSQVSICYNQMSKSKKAYLISSERIFSYAISQQTNTCSIQEWHTKKNALNTLPVNNKDTNYILSNITLHNERKNERIFILE